MLPATCTFAVHCNDWCHKSLKRPRIPDHAEPWLCNTWMCWTCFGVDPSGVYWVFTLLHFPIVHVIVTHLLALEPRTNVLLSVSRDGSHWKHTQSVWKGGGNFFLLVVMSIMFDESWTKKIPKWRVTSLSGDSPLVLLSWPDQTWASLWRDNSHFLKWCHLPEYRCHFSGTHWVEKLCARSEEVADTPGRVLLWRDKQLLWHTHLCPVWYTLVRSVIIWPVTVFNSAHLCAVLWIIGFYTQNLNNQKYLDKLKKEL